MQKAPNVYVSVEGHGEHLVLEGSLLLLERLLDALRSGDRTQEECEVAHSGSEQPANEAGNAKWHDAA
jgi:hypothetical protein